MEPVDEPPTLAGLRILLVEDLRVVAMAVAELLKSNDCEVCKASSVAPALALLRQETIDGALLDINLGGERVDPVAEELDRRGIPFVFMTGYESSDVDKRWRDRPIVHKPFNPETLESVAAATFNIS